MTLPRQRFAAFAKRLWAASCFGLKRRLAELELELLRLVVRLAVVFRLLEARRFELELELERRAVRPELSEGGSASSACGSPW